VNFSLNDVAKALADGEIHFEDGRWLASDKGVEIYIADSNDNKVYVHTMYLPSLNAGEAQLRLINAELNKEREELLRSGKVSSGEYYGKMMYFCPYCGEKVPDKKVNIPYCQCCGKSLLWE
jgi:hypothetical protein